MIGSLSPFHWIIILVALVVLFGGRGKISGIMGDVAKGVREFRDGLKEGETKPETQAAAQLPPVPTPPEREELKR